MASHKKADPLYRGDQADAVSTPHPAADPSLIRHILYLGGYGRESPYLSTSSDELAAGTFAAGGGRTWKTSGQRAEQHGAKHISQTELQTILKSSKTGRARWPNARQRLQALLYVEKHSEHLLDFIPFKKAPDSTGVAVQAMFEKT